MSQLPILVIFAGGTSSRMWPLRQKLLLRFGDKPLLLDQLQRYQSLGFQEAIIIANSENQAEIANLAEQLDTLQTQTVIQAEARGQGDALLQSTPLFANKPHAPLYAVQIHDVVEDDLHRRMLAAFQADPTASYITGYEREDYFPGGYLSVNDAGRISGIVEKPGAENRPSNLVNVVIHIHSEAEHLFAAIEAEYDKPIASDDHYERALDALMKTQVFRVVPYQGHWSALKYPWQVLDVMDYYLAQIQGQTVAESAFIAPTATLVGDVYIGENVKVFPGAAVVGPAYVGAGTIIGNNALVRNSMVLDNCEVGFTTEIARSYVSERCAMHACRVLDSVFAPGVNFSAGCTTANLRLDRGFVSSVVKGAKINSGRDKLGAIIGADAFLGVDVMTMPGVKIGAGAKIGAGMHTYHDIKDGQRAYVKQEIVIVEE